MKLTIAIVLLLILTLNIHLFAQDDFRINYLGNMGVSIVHHDSVIIIDGLHDFYGADYLPTDSTILQSILQKKKPYSHIAAIAVTHKHSDHFDSAIMTTAANLHATTALIGGNQVRSHLSGHIQKRFRNTVTSSVVIHPNLVIRSIRIPHINPARHAAVENYRMEIVWNGFRVIHFGDAAILPDAIRGLASSPDIIVVPVWFLATEGQLLLQQLKPANIIITHIAPSDKEVKISDVLNSKSIPFRVYGDKVKIKRK